MSGTRTGGRGGIRPSGGPPRRSWPGRAWSGAGAVLTAVVLAVAVYPSTYGIVQTTDLFRGEDDVMEQVVEGPVDELWYTGDARDVLITGAEKRGLEIYEHVLRAPRDPLTDVRTHDSVADVHTSCGDACRDLTVQALTLPTDSAVNVASVAGGHYDLAELSGDLDVRVAHGAVTLRDVAGDVDVRSPHAEVHGRTLTGERITVHTLGGPVDLEHSHLPATLDVQTQAGDITVILPEGTRAEDCQVEAETDGTVVVDLPGEDAGGPGEADCRLSLTSASGDIAVIVGDGLPEGSAGVSVPD